LGAPFVESKCRESSCNPAAGHSLSGIVKPDLLQARAKSRVRWEKPSLASLAGLADWSGIWILVRRSWSTRNCSSVELFRDDAGASCGDRFALWIGIGSPRQRFSLDLWLHQHADSFRASSGRYSRSGARVLAGAERSREQTKDRRGLGGYLCGIAVGVDRQPHTGGATRGERREDRCRSRGRPWALASTISEKSLFASHGQSKPPCRSWYGAGSPASAPVVDPTLVLSIVLGGLLRHRSKTNFSPRRSTSPRKTNLSRR
jgi:hypothetical protein